MRFITVEIKLQVKLREDKDIFSTQFPYEKVQFLDKDDNQIDATVVGHEMSDIRDPERS
jgi:hypothetical protein